MDYNMKMYTVEGNVCNVFENAFDATKDYFSLISSEHDFHSLFLSDKPGCAFRTGIYLTPVSESLEYHLLRCSTNMAGPTDTFKLTDREILAVVNGFAEKYFQSRPNLFNHVLAQKYINSHGQNGKQKKAKIKSHSDKTKDMPSDGMIAFCTFYDRADAPEETLTRLRFHLKPCVEDSTLLKQFTITLHHNSAVMIPLSTNRMYTHEIVPSTRPVDELPTRLGYVVRCSKTRAVFVDGTTYVINDAGERIPLHPATQKDKAELEHDYYKENTTDQIVDYGDVYYSLNEGDYMAPLL